MCDRLWSPPTAHPCLMRSHAPCTMDFEHLHVLLSAKSRTRARESGSLRDAPVEVRLRTPVPCAPISYLAAGGGTTYAYGLRRDARCRHVAAVRLVWVSVRYRANVQSVSLCTADKCNVYSD